MGTGHAGYFSKTGASTTNVGLYATASGATNNYAAIFESGNVGIGTTGPAVKLHVSTSATNIVGLIVDTGGGSANSGIVLRDFNFPSRGINLGHDDNTLYLQGTNAGAGGFMIQGASSFIDLSTDNTNPIILSTNNAERARIDSTGNVGIGTTDGFGTSAAKVVSLGAGTAPTTSPANVTQAWTADWNGAGTNALFIRTEEGTQHVFGSNVGMGHITPDRLLHPELADATTAAVSYAQRLSHVVSTASTGSSDGFGVGLEFELETGTDLTNQVSSTIESVWATAANATRKGRLNLYAYDTAARLGLTVEASGAAAMLGFFGVGAVVRPTALTTQLTSITHTAPGTPDYALQNLVQNTGFGFVTADEGNTFLSVVLNLQTRFSELETKLIALGLLQ